MQVNKASISLMLSSLGAAGGAAGSAAGGLVMHGVDGLETDNPRLFRIDIKTGEFTWLGSLVKGEDLSALASLNMSAAMSAGARATRPSGFALPPLKSAPDGETNDTDQTSAADALADIGLDPAMGGYLDAKTGTWRTYRPGEGFVAIDTGTGASTVLIDMPEGVEGVVYSGHDAVVHAIAGNTMLTVDLEAQEVTHEVDLAEHLEGCNATSIGIRDGRICCSGRVGANEAHFAFIDPETWQVDVLVLKGLPVQQAGAVSMSGATPPPASLMMILAAAISAASIPRKVSGVGPRA